MVLPKQLLVPMKGCPSPEYKWSAEASKVPAKKFLLCFSPGSKILIPLCLGFWIVWCQSLTKLSKPHWGDAKQSSEDVKEPQQLPWLSQTWELSHKHFRHYVEEGGVTKCLQWPGFSLMELILPTYSNFRRAAMGLEDVCIFLFFFCSFLGFFSHLLFLFLGHVWCSGATTEDQGFSSCRQSAGLFHAQCHCHWAGTYMYLDNVEMNVRWNHQTASFHCSTPNTLRAVRTFCETQRDHGKQTWEIWGDLLDHTEAECWECNPALALRSPPCQGTAWPLRDPAHGIFKSHFRVTHHTECTSLGKENN